jgi:hypothetical protein
VNRPAVNRLTAAAALLLLLEVVAWASPAHAGPNGHGWGQQRQFSPYERGPYERQYPPQQPPPQRRQDADPQGPQYPQRLSPDERRQLRRDLRDAGRDVYPQRRDWRR